MAKVFAKRVSKKDRKPIDLSDRIGSHVFQMSDEKLLRGAKLEEVDLSKIRVKKQVRTKFNDSSLKELGENIKLNGLIQPLVIHRDGKEFVLICGERRYRAMTLIKMPKAPCFILEDKSDEELMAIQFSENSAREELHYVDKADGIYNYKLATNASERKIQKALGISKSEVHRSLIIAQLPPNIKESAKNFNIEKYVLVEFKKLDNPELKPVIEEQIISGEVRKRVDLNRIIKADAKRKKEQQLELQ